MSELRVYTPGVDEFDQAGYPTAWQTIKHDVRAAAGHRCVRCGHRYQCGAGEWSPCDELCTHAGEVRTPDATGIWHTYSTDNFTIGYRLSRGIPVEAHWRILTVHHLTGDKADCRWWNLVALCQRCHLEIQGKVVMDRVWPHEHSQWFQPYVAGYYAWRYLGQEVSRDEADARLDELLGLEVRQLAFGDVA